jgi:hypothetical protein
VDHVYAELSSIGYSDPPYTPDRKLRGCLVALQGYGIIFVDADDPREEKCFSLAHEASHFIIDHWRPREAVRQSISPNALEVFDGEREPTVVERFKGIRTGVAIRPFEHFMDRDQDGNIRMASLLFVRKQRYATRAFSGKEIAGVLIRDFGLPASVATSYGSFLFSKYIPVPSLRKRFGMK